jgi:hypothetical protein
VSDNRKIALLGGLCDQSDSSLFEHAFNRVVVDGFKGEFFAFQVVSGNFHGVISTDRFGQLALMFTQREKGRRKWWQAVRAVVRVSGTPNPVLGADANLKRVHSKSEIQNQYEILEDPGPISGTRRPWISPALGPEIYFPGSFCF